MQQNPMNTWKNHQHSVKTKTVIPMYVGFEICLDKKMSESEFQSSLYDHNLLSGATFVNMN